MVGALELRNRLAEVEENKFGFSETKFGGNETKFGKSEMNLLKNVIRASRPRCLRRNRPGDSPKAFLKLSQKALELV